MWSFGTTMTIAHDKDKLDKQDKQDKDPVTPSAQSPVTQSAVTQSPVETPTTVAQLDTTRSIFSQRSMKQLGFFFAGASFLTLSTLITRRAVMRKRIATIPSFYQPSNRPVDKIGSDSSMIALEALNLATLNVLGFGIMCTGGLSWAFDLSSIEDLRNRARNHISSTTSGNTDEEAEREVEEWVIKVLGMKDEREKEAGSSPKKDT